MSECNCWCCRTSSSLHMNLYVFKKKYIICTKCLSDGLCFKCSFIHFCGDVSKTNFLKGTLRCIFSQSPGKNKNKNNSWTSAQIKQIHYLGRCNVKLAGFLKHFVTRQTFIKQFPLLLLILLAAHYGFVIYWTPLSHSTVFGCNVILFAIFIVCTATGTSQKTLCTRWVTYFMAVDKNSNTVLFRLAEKKGILLCIFPPCSICIHACELQWKAFLSFNEFLNCPLYSLIRHKLNYQNMTTGINKFTKYI